MAQVQASLITRLLYDVEQLAGLWSAPAAAAQALQIALLIVLVLALGLLLWPRPIQHPHLGGTVAVLTWRSKQHDLDKMPGPWRHDAWPIVGNVPSVLREDFQHKMLELTDTYGGIFRFKYLWRDAVFVSDPGALAVIMGRGDGACDKVSWAYSPINAMCDPHGLPNILTAPSDDMWKAVRKAVAVSFSASNIKKKFPLIRERCQALCARLGQKVPGAVVDVDQLALRVTLDVIGLAGFGHAYGAVEQDEVPDPDHLLYMLPRCFTEVMLRVANPLRAILPQWLCKDGMMGSKAFKAFQTEMRVLLEELKQRGTPSDDDNDIAAQLYRTMKDTPGVTEARILSEIAVLFVGGFETTAHTASWALFNIASIPGVQERVAAELDSLGLLAKQGRPSPRPLELEDLKGLKYLTACNKESMRMYSAVPLVGRVTPNRPIQIGPYTVPPNTVIASCIYALHNTKHNWQEPQAFRPERWLGVPLESYVADCKPPHVDYVHSKGGSDNGRNSDSGRHSDAGRNSDSGRGSAGSTSGSSRSSSEAGEGASSGATSDAACEKHTSEWSSHAKQSGSDSGGSGVRKAAAANFMPFADGARNCVGQSLAKLEVLTLLATLLGHFRLELAPEMGGREGVHARQSACFTLHTNDDLGIRCCLYPRCDETPNTV